MEEARLDKLLLALQPKIEAGNVSAARVALKISERRSKLLGLDGYYKKNPPYDGPLVVIQAVDASDGLESQETAPKSSF